MRMRTARYLAAASLAALALALPQIARADPIALPSGGNVVAGSATLGGNGSDTVSVTQTSNRAIVEWNSFNVGAGGKATFTQPSASSATLNRVTGAAASSIAGRIESNGRVYLVNPNGIEITSTGVVDTRGGFVGSSLDIQNSDFMDGTDSFQSAHAYTYPRTPAAAVTNAGTIVTSAAGLVALLGGSVANSGTITVPQGSIALGVGSAMTLDVNGDGFLQILDPIQLDYGSDPGNLITNSGTITAAGGRVEVRTRVEASGAPLDVVNITGSIRADSVSGAGGTIVLDSGGFSVGSVTVASGAVVSASSSNGAGGQITIDGLTGIDLSGSVLATGTTQGGVISSRSLDGSYVSGTLDASGDTGGRIDLSDDYRVFLTNGGAISARGVNGRGGLVRLGGDFLGGDADAALDPEYAKQVTRFGTLPSLGQGALEIVGDQGTTIDVSSVAGAGGSVTVTAGLASWMPAGYAASLWWRGGAIDARGATPGSVALHSSGVIGTPSSYSLSAVDGPLTAINPGAGGTVLLSAPHFDFTDVASQTSTSTSLLYDAALDRILYGSGANVRLRASDGIAMDLHQEMHEPDGTYYSIAPKIGDLTLQSAGSIDVRGTIDLTHLADHSDPTVAAHYADGTLRDGAITLIANDSRITPTGAARQGLNGITVSGDEYFGDIGYHPYVTTDVLKTRFDGRSVSLSIGAGVGAAAADDPSKPSIGSIDLFGNIAADDQVIRDYSALYWGEPQSNNSRPTSVSLSIYDYGASTVALNPTAVGVEAALTPGKIILRGNTIDAATVNITGSIVLAPVDGIDQTSTIKANSFNWTNASTATIQGIADIATNSLPASLRIEGANALLGLATVLDYGRSGSDLVALGNENVSYALGGTLTRRYGDAALDLGQPLAVVRGDPTGAANSALVTGSLTVAGSDSAAYNVGIRSIAVTAAGDNAAFAPGRYGYVDLTPGTLSLQIVPVGLSLLTYNVASPSYVYGSPLTAVKLAGIVGADDVAPSVQLSDATGTSTLIAKGGGNFAFAANTPVQTKTFDFVGLTGASAGNYFIDLTSAPTGGTLTISPRLLTASAAAASFIYGSPTAAVTLGNVLAGDLVAPTATVGGATVTLAAIGGGFGFEATRGVVNTSYALAGISGAAAGNYALPANYTSLGNILVITPKPLTYGSGSFSRTCGDAVVAPSLTLSGIINNDAVAIGGVGISGNGYTGAIGERTAAGSYSLYATSLTGAQAANYSAPLDGGPTLTINPRLLTLTAIDANYVYGSPTTPVTLSGLLENDVVTLGATVGSAGATLGAVASTTAGTVAGSVSSTAIQQRTYSFGTRGVTDASYTIAGLSGAASGNYALASASQGLGAHLTITPKTLSYAAGSFTRTYGDAVTTPAIGLSGIINGDSVSVSGVAVTGSGGTITLAQKTAAGSYTLSATGLSGAGAANYALPAGIGPTLTINPRPVAFTLLDTAIIYGSGTAPASWGGSTTPLIGDDVRPDAFLDKGTGTSLADFQYASAAGRLGQYSDVGTYRVYATALTGADAANYVYSGAMQQALLRIDPKRVTLAPDTASRVYGSVTLPGTNLVGVLPNDSQVKATIGVIGLNGAIWDGVDSGVGTYQVSTYGMTGSRSENYEFGSNGTYQFAITPRTLTASFSGGSLTYGDTPSGLIQLTGLVSRDIGLVTGAVNLIDASGQSATLSTATNVGTYTAALTSLSGSRAGNYMIGPGGSGTLTVTPRPLSYSLLGASGTYGTATRFGGAILSGFANGDQADGVASLIDAGGTQVATVTGANFGTTSATQAAGSYALKITGLAGVAGSGFNAANYRLAGTDATVTIAPKSVSYTLGIIQRSYGAGDPSGLGGAAVPLSATLNGLLAGDAAAVTAQIAALDEGRFPVDATNPRLKVGTYATTVSGLTGAAASNYRLTDTGSTQGSLTVRPLALSASLIDTSARYGDGVTLATPVGFAPLPGDSVRVVATLQTAAGNQTVDADGQSHFAFQTGPGTYSISPTGLQGDQAGNYILASAQPATLTITPRPINLQLLNLTATYGDTISTKYDVPLIGLVNGDNVSGTGIISGQPVNAGTYAINGLLTGPDAYKYRAVTAPATLTINPLAIRAIGATGGTVESVYGDPLGVYFTGALSDLRVTPAYTLALFSNGTAVTSARPDAGGYQGTVTLGNPNYTLVNPQILYVVDQRPISAEAASVVYGDQPVLSLVNLVAGDTVTARAARLQSGSGATYAPWNADGSFAQYVLSSASLPDAGQSYTVTQAYLSGASAANYVFKGSSVTITPRPITITGYGATALSTWGDATAVFAGLRTTASGQPATLYDSSAVKYSNLVFASDAGIIAPAMSTTVLENGTAVAISNADVGTYSWTPTGIARLTGGLASDCGGSACLSSNYTLAASGSAAADLTITPRVVTYKSSGGTTVYGDAINVGVTLLDLPGDKLATITPQIGFASGGVVQGGGASVSVGGASYATTLVKAPVDTYRVVIASATGTAAGNIVWKATDADTGTLTITPREVTYTTFDGYSLYPIGPVPGSLDKLLSPQLSGLVAGDAVSAVLKVGSSLFTDFGPAFPVGAYPVSVAYLSGPDGDNYKVAAVGNTQGTLTVAALRDTELDGALSLIGNNVTTNIIAGLQKAASDQATAAKAAATATAAGSAPSTTPAASDVVYTPPVITSPGGGSSISDNNGVAPLPGQSPPAGSTSNNSVSSIGVSSKTFITATTDLGPITGGANVSSTFSASVLGVSARSAASATLSYQVSVPVGYGTLTNTTTLGAYGSTSGSIGVLGVTVASQTGVSLKNMVVWTGGCGAATCGASTYQEVGLIAQDKVTFGSDGLGMVVAAGAGASVGAGGSVGGEAGSVAAAAGVSTGKFAAGLSFDTSFTGSQISLGISATIGVGVVGVDLNLSVSLTPFGSIEAYTVAVDPAATAARLAVQEDLTNKAIELRFQQQQFIADLFDGKIGDVQSMDARRDQLAAESKAFQTLATSQGFAIATDGGTVSINDMNAPATMTLYRYTGGWGDTMANAITSDWGSTIYNPVSGGLTTAVDGAKSAANKVADAFSNAANKFVDLF